MSSDGVGTAAEAGVGQHDDAHGEEHNDGHDDGALRERVNELAATVENLREQVTTLEAENERLREEVERLAEKRRTHALPWRAEIEGRVGDLEREEVDVGNLVAVAGGEDLLPIQRWTIARRKAPSVDEADPSTNRCRATFVWEAFDERATRSHGYARLGRKQIVRILETKGCPTHGQTVTRVMKHVARGSGPGDDPYSDENLLSLQGDHRGLRADADEWRDFVRQRALNVRRQATRGVPPEDSADGADATTAEADADPSLSPSEAAVLDGDQDPVTEPDEDSVQGHIDVGGDWSP